MDSCKGKKANEVVAARGHALAAHLLGALLLLACLGSWAARTADAQEQISVESRELKQSPNNENELSDFKDLEKLEKLEQYWSEFGRPRFGRSEYKQPQLLGLRMQRLQQPASLRFRQAALSTYGSRTGSGSSLAELINARLAQRYNSNEAY